VCSCAAEYRRRYNQASFLEERTHGRQGQIALNKTVRVFLCSRQFAVQMSEGKRANMRFVSGGENEMQHGRLTMDVNAGLKMLMFQ